MIETIDALDRKILFELQRDASISLEALGDAVGLSRNATWRRVRALDQSGVIRRRVAVLDADMLGLKLSVFIQIRTSRHDPEWLTAFAAATRDMSSILAAYRMSGDLDYLVHARVADMAAYDTLYQELIRRVDMSDVAASFVMEELKETTALPV
ncbi:Lrp/AsnC family transcriptional regulator [Boseongicola aestuarii]|uniref:Leucine-responsive regulatory protein n=1 Tax=Boseongicola aestuarii TaxID=1470561 RepID=A0A238J523_9RHOB|nr:Lrp/AsnC family transcriptional regulator [Boseongicola aestuarii]SMX25322.1 Leucine-responsive regulatory protein [Boseongicola aestuarii]